MATFTNSKFVGTRVVWGVQEPKPIHGAPAGKQRLRMRNTAAATLFVRTADGVRKFVLEDREHYWFVNPRLEQGRNVRYRFTPGRSSASQPVYPGRKAMGDGKPC